MTSCLNMFPSKNGITSDISSQAIILGFLNPYYNKLKITFGSYAQVYIGTTNSKKQRTGWAIALIPSNKRGGYYFMSLAVVKYIHTLICIELTINDHVIYRLNYLETKEKEPEITQGYPIFEWIPGIPITDKDNVTPKKTMV